MQTYHLENQHDSFNERLKRAFPFIDADLEANRAGKLTPAQHNRLRDEQEAITCMVWYFVLICLFGVCCSFSMSATAKPKSGGADLSSLLMLIVIVVPMAAFLVLSQSKRPQETESIQVLSHQGRMTELRPRGRAATHIIIDQMTLEISLEAGRAFVLNEEYIVYYTADTLRAVSAEHILKLPPSPQ